MKTQYHYISIEGNIGAGKTTLARMVSTHLHSRLILEEFEDNPFLPLFYQNPDRYALQTELTFLTDRYKQLSSLLVSMSLFEPVTVSDYYIYKSRLFARNNLNDDDFRLYGKIFSIVESALPKPDLMIYLHQKPQQLLTNIRKRGRAYEEHITEGYLDSIQQAYLSYIRAEQRFPILLIEMEDIDFLKNKQDFSHIVDLLRQTFSPGLHRISMTE
ncbi:MAG: deoxynucleoside kinase [Bacteroidales bacterium]